jgi:hypothetical protein
LESSDAGAMPPERAASRRAGTSLFENDVVLVNLAVQGISADPERLRGAADIPMHSFQFPQQGRTFCVAQRR